MKKFRKNLQLYTFLLGFLLIVVAYFIPTDPFPTIKPMGIATIFIAPVLGILGIVFSLINKKYRYIVSNVLLVLSFFILMNLFYLIPWE